VADKKRLFKLAEEIKVEALDIIAYLKSEGVEGITAASYIDAEKVQNIKDHFSGKKAKSKKAAKTDAEPAAKGTRKRSKAAEAKDKTEVKEVEVAKVEAEAPKVEEVQPLQKPSPVPVLPETPPPVTLAKSAEPTVISKPAEKVEEKPKEAPKLPEVLPKIPEAPVIPVRPQAQGDVSLRARPFTQGPPRSAEKVYPPSTYPPAQQPTRPKRPVMVGNASPTQTIRQHISSKFGEIKPRTLPPRQAPRQGTPQGRSGPSPAFAPPPQKPQIVPTRDHRGAVKPRSNFRQFPQEGKQERLRTGFEKTSVPLVTKPAPFQPLPVSKSITLTEGVTVKELSEKLDVKAKDVIKRLLDKGIFATMNQTLDEPLAIDLSRDFGAEASIISFEEDAEYEAIAEEKSENLTPRPPVVTIMGHVDHGKTSLLDAIRETNVTSQEAGGITQHIGAYQVEKNNRVITFLDTPGHEAFTMMRARGAKVTDLVVLVVAADDGVMPQTLEAIAHARAAKVPIVVAINKIDKPNAQIDRVKKSLAENGLLAEDWGGETVTVEISAKQKTNLDLLLEMILLVSDMQGLRANPHRSAVGTILEAKLDKGRGPVATVLVQNGALEVGDSFIVGAVTGRVRAMFDYRGLPLRSAGPSAPVEVLGLQSVPQAGDLFQVMTDVSKVKHIGSLRQLKLRESQLAKSSRLTLEQLHEQLKAGAVKELPLILKADVQGSVEVLAETLTKLSNEKVKVKIIHRGTGAITETDVLFASTSNAIIIGFNVRPEKKVADLAQQEGVDIRLHTIIYNVTNEIKSAMVGMLDQTFKEVYQGTAEVRNTFRVPKFGTVAGCYISDGKVARTSQVRLLRDNVVIYEGKIASLKRFKDDASEVRSGFECGIGLENFSDVKNGDLIEAFVMERVAAEVV
jgi:translation initiation factor IF-2